MKGELKEALTDTAASLAAAISLLERSPKTAAPSNKMFDQMLADYRASLQRARAALSQPEGPPAMGVEELKREGELFVALRRATAALKTIQTDYNRAWVANEIAVADRVLALSPQPVSARGEEGVG